MSIAKTLLVVPALLIAALGEASAQRGARSWNTLNLHVPVTKDLDFRAGHMRSFDMNNGFTQDFHQTHFRVAYQVNRRIDVFVGDMITYIPVARETRNRLYVKVSHSTRLGRAITWTNSLQAETNSANEPRFRQRFIASTRFATRKRLDFLNLRPSLSYALYYNIGGKAIRYFDGEGKEVARQTPDGFHRGRLSLNLNSKINNRFGVSLYYTNQHEFNLLSGEQRKMNVTNPRNGRIQRPFDNYDVIGATLNVYLGRKGGNKPLLK